MNTHVGFTGSRDGMTWKQHKMLYNILEDLDYVYFHHGDCVGSDAIAAVTAHLLGFHVKCHPPKNEKLRAFVALGSIKEPRPYLERNRDIVDACDLLLATPRGEEDTGGTWFTIRYARSCDKTVHIIMPSGTVTVEGV